MRTAKSARGTLPGLGACLLACALTAGCGSGAAVPAGSGFGPAVTLRIGVYGTPGFRQAGLYAEYGKLHPNITIVEDDTAQQGSYWQALQGNLAGGHGLDDIQAIPVSDISGIIRSQSSGFVPLNPFGGSSLQNDWLPWVWQEATNPAGQTFALGADIGPMAVCYRPSLLRAAGLPADRATLAKDWSTWQGYLSSGARFRAHAPRGTAFLDSVTSLYNAMVSQAREQYYSAAGSLVLAGNPVISTAWNEAVQAASAGLSARLSPLSAAWNTGLASGAFATLPCSAGMLGDIKDLSGAAGSGQWDVTTAPGGTGNTGGFYLAVTSAGKHQQDAFQLIQFLTSQYAGTTLFSKEGAFPSNSLAVNALYGATNAYFSNAPVGAIFGQSADRAPTPIFGPAADAVGQDVDNALAQVESQGRSPAAAWQAAVAQAAASAAG